MTLHDLMHNDDQKPTHNHLVDNRPVTAAVTGPEDQPRVPSRDQVNATAELSRRQRRRAARIRIKPEDRAHYGWRLGTSEVPRGEQIHIPRDKHTLVAGPTGSGKTLDLLAGALIHHPGPALNTNAKVTDLYLTITARQRPLTPGGPARPVVVLDPYGLAPGLPEFVFDPIAGCHDPMIAERRAAAFAHGTVSGGSKTVGDDGARFYRDQCTKVLKCYFLAAALTGSTLDHVLRWAAGARDQAEHVEKILTAHPAAPGEWADALRDTITRADPRTASNTIVTVHSALNLFFQPELRARCVPSPGRPGTDVEDVIRAGGTIYLLGREDALLSASPLMTAVAEHVLDTAAALTKDSPYGKLLPWFLAVLDEFPSMAPIPSTGIRLGSDRDLGICYILACQAWQQIVAQYGPAEAEQIWRVTNYKVLFGGGVELDVYEQLCRLYGETEIERTSRTTSRGGTSYTTSTERVPILTPAQIMAVPNRHAFVAAPGIGPMITKLDRIVEGAAGKNLAAEQQAVRAMVNNVRRSQPTNKDLAAQAIVWSQAHGYGALIPDNDTNVSTRDSSTSQLAIPSTPKPSAVPRPATSAAALPATAGTKLATKSSEAVPQPKSSRKWS